MADNLNAAQMQAIEQRARDKLGEVVGAMQLRKWAVDQALGIFSSSDDFKNPTYVVDTAKDTAPRRVPTSIDPMKLAAEIYDFVAKPALEFKVEP